VNKARERVIFMALGLLGKKVGMTQLFDEHGHQVPATVIEAGPCYVTDLRTQEKDGYVAVQLGFDRAKEKNTTKPKMGQMKRAGAPALRYVREIRTESIEGLELGQALTVDNFQAGDYVDIEGISKGCGFQGVVKRHHFKGGEKAHGSKFGRAPGSIGASAFPSRVIKGVGMPGQMGNEQVTVQNLPVLKVDAEHHLLVVLGAVPGADTGYVVVRSAVKKPVTRGWKVPVTAKSGKPDEVSAKKDKSEKHPGTDSGESPVKETPTQDQKAESSEKQS